MSVAEELWNDIRFVSKRVNYQEVEGREVARRYADGKITMNRCIELLDSIKVVRDRFLSQKMRLLNETK